MDLVNPLKGLGTKGRRPRRAGALAMLSAAVGIGLGSIAASLSPGMVAWLGTALGAEILYDSSALAQQTSDASAQEGQPEPPAPGMRTMSAGNLTRFKAGEQEVSVYRRAPAGEGTWPGLVVLHDGWGLTPRFQNELGRLADQGFVVLALDMNRGKVARDADKGREMGVLVDQAGSAEQAMALVHHLKYQPEVGDHRVGILGFGVGAAVALRAAMRSDETSAVAVFYPVADADPSALRRIACPVLAVFGGQDTVVTPARAEAMRAALREAGRTAELKIYDGASHGFMNPETSGHDAGTAQDAWSLAASFFRGIL
jgi:carboxymethylenebutenolidase